MGPSVKADGAATVARMKAMPTDDDCFGKGLIREDGRVLHPSYLWEVKTPAESKGPWDYYKPISSRRPTRRSVRSTKAAARWSRPDATPLPRAEGRGLCLRQWSRTMFMIFGIPAPLLFGQLLLGLINGAFYALLSLGLAVIFGMLNIINFAHGALFMLGAFVAWGSPELHRHRLLAVADPGAPGGRRVRRGAGEDA